MRDRLFTLLSAASLALCVCACSLWVRSLWVFDRLRWGEPDPARPELYRLTSVTSERGGIAFVSGAIGPEDYQILQWSQYPAERYADGAGHHLGFAASVGPVVTVVVPHGCVALLTAVVPIRSHIPSRRLRHRRAAGG